MGPWPASDLRCLPGPLSLSRPTSAFCRAPEASLLWAALGLPPGAGGALLRRPSEGQRAPVPGHRLPPGCEQPGHTNYPGCQARLKLSGVSGP